MPHCKAKVCDLDGTIFEEDIGWLQISVDYSSGLDIVIAVYHLVHQPHRISLRQAPLPRDVLGEVAVAQLSDDIGVILGGVYFVEIEDVTHVLE